MSLWSLIRSDLAANRGHVKTLVILFWFRLLNPIARRKGSLLWYLCIPLMLTYRVIVEYLLCIELRLATVVGAALKIEHAFGLVINDHAVIGNRVHLRHCTTIGCVKLPDGSQGPSPVIEDDVEIGSNAVILGGITIGRGAKIGAGSVVVKSVPPGAVAVGNPARILTQQTASPHSNRIAALIDSRA